MSLKHPIIAITGSSGAGTTSVKRTFDLRHQVEERPWTMVGGSFLAGLAISLVIPKGRPAQESRETAVDKRLPILHDRSAK